MGRGAALHLKSSLSEPAGSPTGRALDGVGSGFVKASL